MRRLSPPTLALLALACACAPQDPADLPYRTATVERFADGSVRKGKLVEPTAIGGFPAMGWTRFHPGGALRSVQLAEDFAVQGHLLPAETYLWLTEDERLESVWLGRDAELAGLPCNGGGKVMASFHPDGSLKSCFLARDTEVQGVPCEASAFTPVRFHPNGRLARCKLSRRVTLDGAEHARGDVVSFDAEGRLVASD